MRSTTYFFEIEMCEQSRWISQVGGCWMFQSLSYIISAWFLLPQMFHFFTAGILMRGQLCEVGNGFL